MNLNDRALLTQLKISQWTARKLDKKATSDVANIHGASTAAGRYNKRLLPMSDALDNIHKKSTFIRQSYYENTLPWGMDGSQILPTSNYLAFMHMFRKEKAEWESLCREFFSQYDLLVQDAPRTLGSLYNPQDYPALTDIQHKFHMDLAVFPVPDTDFRVAIGSDELTRIQQDVEARVKQAGQDAMRDVWQRLFDKVKHIADKLADPKAIFRDSTIENARELCDLLPRLNFTDDPNLEALRQEVQGKLFHNPESLRVDPVLRRDTAAEAKAIIDKMSVFMGGI